MLTREQIEEIQGEAPGERDSNQGPVERERHSRAPVLLVEAEVRQGRGSGWVPTHRVFVHDVTVALDGFLRTVGGHHNQC